MNFIRICLRRLAAGGDEGNRTLDPLLAGQVLSQLSYTPMFGTQQSLEIEQQIVRTQLCLVGFVFFVSSYERSYSNRPCSP